MEILELNNISKSFGAIKALDNVSLSLRSGEVLGLMGDNGAGKSTLIKIIAGNFKQSSGTINFENQKVEFSKPMEARDKGIEVVYQDLALCDNLTAASNIFLTREIKRNFGLVKIILKQPLMVELSFQNHTILAIDYKMASKIEISQLSLDK